MTDLAAAMADTSDLTPFEGRPVIRTTIKVTKAGDGLSEALSIEPEELHVGQRLRLVMDVVVDEVRFDRLLAKGTDTGQLVRVGILEAEAATILRADIRAVDKAMREQGERLRKAREQAREGKYELGDDEAMAKAVADDHAAGKHKQLVAGCAECDAEVEADNAGD